MKNSIVLTLRSMADRARASADDLVRLAKAAEEVGDWDEADRLWEAASSAHESALDYEGRYQVACSGEEGCV